MAYSTLVSLENTIDQILHSDQSSISSGGKQHIISIDKYVISLKVFLEDFPEKARKLEARMRDAAMEAEDIIEWFITEKVSNCAFQCIQYWIEDLRRIKFEFQLRKVSDELDSIAREMVEIQESMRINDAKFDDSVEAISSSSHVADAEKISVVGLNEDLMEIMGWLCGNSPQLQILPITGMGGIGKTTLARNAYDAPLIIEQFDVRAWITVSQDYSEQRILSDLIDGMKGFITQISKGVNIDKAEKVYKVLVGRKFLIVMDDIWSTKVLDDVRKLFPNDNNGSRILLTTRLADVATYANSSLPSHEMNLMDADQSWNLLQKKVFEHQGIIPRELEKIGREIARSCGGLPLAVVVVAGVLSTVSKNLTSWNKIARNVKVTLSTTERKIEKILYLSYNHLPQHLRPCFLLMGGFPEDHEIRVVDLIRLWVAEGFVK